MGKGSAISPIRSGDMGPSRRRLWAIVAAAALVISLGPLGGMEQAKADSMPIGGLPATVTDDVLPTVQIDGVAWTQLVVGNTVYVGGDFQTARPAGSAAGVNTVARANLLAYDIRTGALISSFAPQANAKVYALAMAPDGSRLYVGGLFTQINGVNEYRLAALDPTTGAVVTRFNAGTDYSIRAIVATSTTVYVGGAFGSANGQPRKNLAAFRASDGAVVDWAPTADDNQVMAMTLTPDKSRVVVGGSFTTLNGSAQAYGLGAVDAVTGTLYPLLANGLSTGNIRNATSNAAINSLTTDGQFIYGSGYHFGSGGSIEGSFVLDPTDGRLVLVNDCHGDTYSVYPRGGVLYTVGHAHFCGNLSTSKRTGFPQTTPWAFQRANAFSSDVRSVNQPNSTGGYADHGGWPSSELLHWFPELQPGTFTGQTQAAWSVSGNADYIVLGGEFPRVNGVAQQGLVRFATPSKAAKQSGPIYVGSSYVPKLQTLEAGSVRVTFPANVDRDNENLTYRVYRDYRLDSPVYEKTVASTFWDRPMLGFTDSGLEAGRAYSYHVRVTDPDGNLARGDAASVTVSGSGTTGAYVREVMADLPLAYWRLGESTGTAMIDAVDLQPGTVGTVTRGRSGAVVSDSDTATGFRGTTSSTAYTATVAQAPNTFSVETWVRTTTNRGGLVVGFGNTASGASSTKDRAVYMRNDGRLTFVVNRRVGGWLPVTSSRATTTADGTTSWPVLGRWG